MKALLYLSIILLFAFCSSNKEQITAFEIEMLERPEIQNISIEHPVVNIQLKENQFTTEESKKLFADYIATAYSNKLKVSYAVCNIVNNKNIVLARAEVKK